MHDLKYIRENPKDFDAALMRRGAEPVAESILALDENRRAILTQMQNAQARRNDVSKSIGAAMGKGDTATATVANLPATVIPTGRSVDGLPVGLQAIGPFLEDRTPLRFAQCVHREFGGIRSPAIALG